MAQGRYWEASEELWLRAAISEGLTRDALRDGLGRDIDTIRRKCKRMGLTIPPTDMTKYQESNYRHNPVTITRATHRLGVAISALFNKMTADEIAAVVGTSPANEPGTERVEKTCSVERHINAVQAERIAA